MVVFGWRGVLWCFCFTVFSVSVARSRVRFPPSACHRCEKLIVKFFSFNERSCSVSKCGCSVQCRRGGRSGGRKSAEGAQKGEGEQDQGDVPIPGREAAHLGTVQAKVFSGF